MKKLAPSKQAEALKYLFRNPLAVIAERQKPKRSNKSKVIKMAWYVGDTDIELTDKTVDKMEEKEWIKACGDGKYNLDETGHALAEMMVGQKEYDFSTGLWVKVDNYDEDPLHKPDIVVSATP
jgi:hypothetical protein